MITVRRIAYGLGWFSVALGLAELLDSRDLERFLGIANREGTFRFFGLRELAAGIGILSSSGPHANWLWARVAGDVLDLGALGAALESKHSNKNNVTVAIASVAGITALDVYCAAKLRYHGTPAVHPT